MADANKPVTRKRNRRGIRQGGTAKTTSVKQSVLFPKSEPNTSHLGFRQNEIEQERLKIELETERLRVELQRLKDDEAANSEKARRDRFKQRLQVILPAYFVVILGLLVSLSAVAAIDSQTSFLKFLQTNKEVFLNVAIGALGALIVAFTAFSSKTFTSSILRASRIFFGIEEELTRTFRVSSKVLEAASEAFVERIARSTSSPSNETKPNADEAAKKEKITAVEKAIEDSAGARPTGVSIDDLFMSTLRRIERERQTLSVRTGLNVLAGIFIAAIGLALLWSFVAHIDNMNFDAPKTFAVVAVRISIVLFLSVFALFFLNQYRSGLNDMKYYVNEHTNNSAMYSGIQLAIQLSDKKLLGDLSKQMIAIERNFVLKKGETTVGLAHLATEGKFIEAMTSKFANLTSGNSTSRRSKSRKES